MHNADDLGSGCDDYFNGKEIDMGKLALSILCLLCISCSDNVPYEQCFIVVIGDISTQKCFVHHDKIFIRKPVTRGRNVNEDEIHLVTSSQQGGFSKNEIVYICNYCSSVSLTGE